MAFAGEDDQVDPKSNFFYKVVLKIFSVDPDTEASHFFARINGKLHITMVFLVFLVIGSTDVLSLADRLFEYTKTVAAKDMQSQVLDNMDLERERGITIKSHAIQMEYEYKGEKYVLNLIDTPGHVDFSYEVSRSIAACEGALLIVDAAQGIQAQTISNLYMAIENDLEIIPVINKIDLPSAMPEEIEDQIVELIGCPRDSILRASGKTGEGVYDILNAIVERVPAPSGDPEAPLQCLIFNSLE